MTHTYACTHTAAGILQRYVCWYAEGNSLKSTTGMPILQMAIKGYVLGMLSFSVRETAGKEHGHLTSTSGINQGQT